MSVNVVERHGEGNARRVLTPGFFGYLSGLMNTVGAIPGIAIIYSLTYTLLEPHIMVIIACRLSMNTYKMF